MHELDLTNLPPDTFVVFPDRLGNYDFDHVELASAHTEASFELPPEFVEARVPEAMREPSDISISALDRNWISLRPVIGYGLAGFAVCVFMFIGARTPAIPPTAMTQQQPLEQRTVLAEAAPSQAERNLRRSARNENRYYGPEVIVHHYEQPAREMPATQEIKKYSDWR